MQRNKENKKKENVTFMCEYVTYGVMVPSYDKNASFNRSNNQGI